MLMHAYIDYRITFSGRPEMKNIYLEIKKEFGLYK